jgi:hypothetical protein
MSPELKKKIVARWTRASLLANELDEAKDLFMEVLTTTKTQQLVFWSAFPKQKRTN